jgi:hypothetical protein
LFRHTAKCLFVTANWFIEEFIDFNDVYLFIALGRHVMLKILVNRKHKDDILNVPV